MKSINIDLEKVKSEIGRAFIEPLENDILKDFLIGESKYIRSLVTILYFKSQNVFLNEEVYKIIASGEIIHSASLLHDDVIDNANIRRGKSTIAKVFSPKISILAGDYLIAFATEKLLELNNDEILTLFKDCIKKMCKAEIRQYFTRESLISQHEYIEICKDKTANLFKTILESCSLILNSDIEKSTEFGEYFGVYFQIKNDLEKTSAEIDKANGIYTAKDILGIEKTKILLDNYKENMMKILKDFPENVYRKRLEDLIDSL